MKLSDEAFIQQTSSPTLRMFSLESTTIIIKTSNKGSFCASLMITKKPFCLISCCVSVSLNDTNPRQIDNCYAAKCNNFPQNVITIAAKCN